MFQLLVHRYFDKMNYNKINPLLISFTLFLSVNMFAQQQSISGVSMDEEAINLMQYQRAFQGSARFITVVDEMLQTVLGLIR